MSIVRIDKRLNTVFYLFPFTQMFKHKKRVQMALS